MQKQLISRALAAGHPEIFGPCSTASAGDGSSPAGHKRRFEQLGSNPIPQARNIDVRGMGYADAGFPGAPPTSS